MPKFLVTGEITISIHTEVVAKTPEAAKRSAAKRPTQTISEMSGDAGSEWVVGGELDGEPKITEVEEA